MRALVARLDSDGDVLLAGPAVRAVAAGCSHLVLLVSPDGEQAARLLPGVGEVLVWCCPWTGYRPASFDAPDALALVDRLRSLRLDVAVVLTSDHQSPLPLALLLRLAGVPRVVGSSHDYPGSLLDVRHPPGGPHEVQRGLSLTEAAGFALPSDDDGRLAVRRPLPPAPRVLAGAAGGYIVLHPWASVGARSLLPDHARAIARRLTHAGSTVVLTGARGDRGRADDVGLDGAEALDLVGRTSFDELASTLAGARCVVSVNTSVAHLAAAVGTPVVAMHSPVVPAQAWRPWGVPHVVLGDQTAGCSGTRARECPIEGHPCLSLVDPDDVVRAVRQLTRAVAA